MRKIKYLFISLSLCLLLCSCTQGQPARTEEGSTVNSLDASGSENEQTADDSQAVEAEFKEFNIYDVQFELSEECAGIEFLNREQQQTFRLATFVYTVCDLDSSEFFRCANPKDSFPSQESPFYSTGFTYESVMNGFKSVISEDILDELVQDVCDELNGEFVCSIGARGASADFDGHLEFAPVEVTNQKVVFQITASYSDPETFESVGESAFNFEMTLVDGRWVMTEYEFWK